jgi:nicotinamidase-related amidase
MDSSDFRPRSEQLMAPENTILVVIDFQEKLLPAMRGSKTIEFNAGRLLDAADCFDIPVVATEQYPQGLGPTVSKIAKRITEPIIEKKEFSAFATTERFGQLRRQGKLNAVICGIESHVCVLQTAFDLMSDGWRTFIAVDAVSSRFKQDRRTAITRLEGAGATLVTTEMTMFEWCRTAEHPEFKHISRLAREVGP